MPVQSRRLKSNRCLAICLTREIECRIINQFRLLHEQRLRSLAPLIVGKHTIIMATLLVYFGTISAKADSCPSIKDEIITDRPDITNSSVVVPSGSLQIENGVSFSMRNGDQVIDGTNTRLRYGIANCLEFLVDPRARAFLF
jgi:hypothetical protein